MGRQKLLMPWGNQRVIDRVLTAWKDSRVDQILVVLREDDQPLIQACQEHQVTGVIATIPPLDMKASLCLALTHLEKHEKPLQLDQCLFAPADLPTLNTRLIDCLIDVQASPQDVVIPVFGDKQGHPVRVPWRIAQQIFRLAPDEGLNRLLESHSKYTLQLDPSLECKDIDTPEDYRRELQRARDFKRI